MPDLRERLKAGAALGRFVGTGIPVALGSSRKGFLGAVLGAADGTDAPQDLNASPEYREQLARVLVRRALETI